MVVPIKIENNFYDRFMALKPEGVSEPAWFSKFGWNIEQVRQKRSDWQRMEMPKPGTIIEIQKVLNLSLEDIVRLQYGMRISFQSALRAGGGRTSKKVRSAASGKRGA